MKNKFQVLALILLVLAIALSPSFPAGTLENGKVIELRIEDFLVAILGLMWIGNFLIAKRNKFKKPPLFFPILAWLSFAFVSFLINFLLGNLDFVKGFFYFLKEVQYFFLYFLFFYYIKDFKTAKIIIISWLFVALANMSYVFYQILGGFRAGNIYQFISGQVVGDSDYGAAALAEEGSLPRGVFFLLFFVFLINVFLYYYLNLDISKVKKLFIALISLSPVLGVFYSGSRTAFLGLALSLFLTAFFFIIKKRNFKVLAIVIILLILVILILSAMPKNFSGPRRIIKTVSSLDVLISETYRSRIDSAIIPTFREAASQNNHLFLLLGFGKGYFGEAHNQYLLNFISLGAIGSIIFLLLIFTILKRTWRHFSKKKSSFSVGLTGGLFVATLGMLLCSLASDPFMVVKSAEVYWVFVGITMAVLSLEKTDKKVDNRGI